MNKMDYISGEQYAAATASSAYTTANNLEKQVKELIASVNNLKIEIDVIKNRLNNLDTSKGQKHQVISFDFEKTENIESVFTPFLQNRHKHHHKMLVLRNFRYLHCHNKNLNSFHSVALKNLSCCICILHKFLSTLITP